MSLWHLSSHDYPNKNSLPLGILKQVACLWIQNYIHVMASIVAKIRRFQIIIQSLEKGAFTKKELIEKMEAQGFEVSNRTFERDLEDLRRDFNVELEYNTKLKAYVFEKDSRDADRLKQVLELSQEVQALQASFFADANQRDRIQFEPFASKGTENLEILTNAIHEEKVILFRHFNYHTEKYTDYEVFPLMLKEYGGRWYLYAYAEIRKDCRTFGLDRIEQVQVLNQGFKRDLYTDNFSKFSQVIGVNYSDQEHPSKIILRCTALQAWYMDSSPWHPSLQKIKQDDDNVWYELEVIPNYELKQKILSMADQIEVIEPDWFRNELQDMLRAMTARYSSE